MQMNDDVPVMSRETRYAYLRGIDEGMDLGIKACILIVQASEEWREAAAALHNLLRQKVPSSKP